MRFRLDYPHVASTLALVLALGTGGAYAAATITGADVVDESLTGSDIRGAKGTATAPGVNGSITTYDISGQPADPGTGQPFVQGTLTTWDIRDGTLRATDLAPGSVLREHLGAGSVGPAALSSEAVASSHLQEGAVDSRALRNGGVGWQDIGTGAVGSPAIANGSILAEDVRPAAIGSAAIADGSVRAAELANAAVTGAKLASRAVGTEHEGARPSARLWRGTRQTLPMGVQTAIAFDRAIYETDPTMWDAAAPTRLVAPKDGIYAVDGHAEITQKGDLDATWHALAVTYRGGTELAVDHAPEPHVLTRLSGATQVRMRAGDWVELHVEVDGSGDDYVSGLDQHTPILAMTWIAPL
jgi:hypothetical protein